MHRIFVTVLFLALSLTLPAAAMSTTKPSDQAEVVKSLLVDMNVAMVTGDADFVLGNAIVPESAKAQFEASGALLRARNGLFQALAKAVQVPPRFPTYEEAAVRLQAQMLRESTVTINNESADVTLPSGSSKVTFKKVDGKWKYDMSNMTALEPVTELEARLKVYGSLRVSLDAGEYRTFADFETALKAHNIDWRSKRP